MKFFAILFLGALLLIISVQAYRLHTQKAVFQESLEASVLEANALSGENVRYRRDIEFNKKDENLIKEAQTKYNVRKEGEKMFILIPPKPTSSTE